MMGASRRIGWIDHIRAMGAVSIVLLHVLVSTNIAIELSVARSVVYAAVGIVFTRWAVPAFFMISGMLVLDPSRALGWRRAVVYARRMVLVLATFGFVFALMEEVFVARAEGMDLGWWLLARSVCDVLTGNTWDHLWYVYAQLASYLVAPVVRAVRNRLSGRGYLVLVSVLCLCVLVVPTLMRVEANRIIVGITLFMLGGVVSNVRLCAPVAAAGVVSLATMLVVSVAGVLAGRGDEGYIFLQGSCFAAAYAVFVLTCARRVFGDEPVREDGVVGLLARDSFCIYLVHPLFVHALLLVIDVRPIPAGVFEASAFVGVLLLSVASAEVLRRMPVMRDIL